MNDKLKKIIFDKLYMDLKNVEIIPYNDSIWFIDRENKYWYLEYEKSGFLWWNYRFFSKFFILFSLEDDYQPIIAEWVEEVLNCKINTTVLDRLVNQRRVEEVLNCKVNTTFKVLQDYKVRVEKVLNCKVNTTVIPEFVFVETLEAVLNQNK